MWNAYQCLRDEREGENECDLREKPVRPATTRQALQDLELQLIRYIDTSNGPSIDLVEGGMLSLYKNAITFEDGTG